MRRSAGAFALGAVGALSVCVSCTASPNEGRSSESAIGMPHDCKITGDCPPPTLRDCERAPPNALPDGCDQVLSDAIHTLASRPSSTRNMYHPDPSVFPANLATTTPSNLSTGVFAPASNAAGALFDTHVSYESGILRDWVYRLGSLKTGAPRPWAAHDWYAKTTQPPPYAWGGFDFGSAMQTDCREYVWRLWQPLSYMEDQIAACGSDLGCVAGVALQDPHGLASFVASDGTTLQLNPTTPERPSYAGAIAAPAGVFAKNDFFAVNPAIFDNQDDRLFSEIANPWCGGVADSSVGAVPTGARPTFKDARLTTPDAKDKLAAIRALLDGGYRVGIGLRGAPPAGNPDLYGDVWSYHRAMARRTIGNVAGDYWDVPPGFVPISLAERNAIRERALHLRELIDRYNKLTALSCALPLRSAQMPLSTVQHDYTKYATSEYGDAPVATAAPSTPGSPQTTHRGPPIPIAHAASVNPGGGGAGGGVNPMTLYAEYVAASAHDIQEQILALMLDEYGRPDHGCFDVTTDHRDCDWFPEDFAPVVTGIARADRELDYQQCVTWTGNSVAGRTVADVADGIHQQIVASEQALTRTPGIYANLDPDANANWKSDATGTARSSKKTGFGEILAGGKKFGDENTFGAGYDYGAYWKVTPKFDANGGGDSIACELDGDVRVSFNAHAGILKKVADGVCGPCLAASDGAAAQLADVASAIPTLCPSAVVEACKMRYRFEHLADLDYRAQVTPSGTAQTGHFFFAGEQLWNSDQSVAIHASWPAQPIDIAGLHDTVVVVVVPVTFDVHGEVSYGANFDATLSSVRNCGHPTIAANATVTPYAYVDAFGSAMIGIDGAGAGVRGHVRVIDAHLPVSATASVDGDGMLSMGASANLNLDYLSGSMSVFAEVLFEEAEVELARWGGYHTTIPIFAWSGKPMNVAVLTKNRWSNYSGMTP